MPPEKKNRPGKNGSPNAFLRYTGMATQMAATMVAGVLLGQWADRHYQTSKPWFTGIFAVIAVVLSMYFAIKDLLRK